MSNDNQISPQIISGFFGTGKTSFVKKYSGDAIEFNTTLYQNKDFPKNYVDDLIKLYDNAKYSFIIIPFNQNIKSYIDKNTTLRVTYVLPSIILKVSYYYFYQSCERYSTTAIKIIITNWNRWIEEVMTSTGQVIVLNKNQKMGDLITPYM